jgi:hypothetical protein
MIALAILCCVPMYALTIITVIGPLAMDAAGAAHAGRYRRWHVSLLARRAAGTNMYSTTKTNVSYGTIQTDYGSHQGLVERRGGSA